MKLIVLLLLISHCIQAEPVRSSSYGIMLASQYQITAPWLKIADATLQADKTLSLDAISNLLHTQYPELSDKLRTYILTSIKCVEHNNIAHNNILSIIDYSLPSNRRRLWIFDLGAQKLLFHTYVSHGLKSGILSPEYFSDRYNSKATSIGIYKAQQIYYGRHGMSLKLNGLERGFNENAANRAVVMHGGWYVDDDFIKSYGRAGRSWGCPAVSEKLSHLIINTIKDDSLLIAYYPSDDWLYGSRFLNCEHGANTAIFKHTKQIPTPTPTTAILFASRYKNSKLKDSSPIMVISASNYKSIFNTAIPLERMLRRQINNIEYIALNNPELQQIINTKDLADNNSLLNKLNFVVPTVKMVRGYYETQMNFINMGKIHKITPNPTNTTLPSYSLYCDAKPVTQLRSVNQFIRWIGL